MDNQDIAGRLQSTLSEHGFKSSIVSASHASELRETIAEHMESGVIDRRGYRGYVAFFEKMLSQQVPWAQSMVAIAVPRPVLEVIFAADGQKRSTLIPPTYEHSVDATVKTIIEGVLAPHGYRFVRAELPKKLLAARSGLARYGKNNIAYVKGMGSYLRLLTFYTDLPTVADRWQDPQVLDECAGCAACINKCPAGAIDPDRFYLRTTRCLTYHNESPDPFPSWIDESWHHCLVGCMKCQHFCPANKDVRSWRRHLAEFTEEETALLLKGLPACDLPPTLVAKFDDLGLLEEPVVLARNLKSVLTAKGRLVAGGVSTGE